MNVLSYLLEDGNITHFLHPLFEDGYVQRTLQLFLPESMETSSEPVPNYNICIFIT